MTAWAGWKNQQRQLCLHKSGRGRGKSGQEDERGGKLPGKAGMGQGNSSCSPFTALLRPGRAKTSHSQGVLGWLKALPAPQSKAAAVWHRAATARVIFKPSSGAQAKLGDVEVFVTAPRVPGAAPSNARSPSTTEKLWFITFFPFLFGSKLCLNTFFSFLFGSEFCVSLLFSPLIWL